MANNITADEVRYAGNLDESDYADAMLESAAFILAGDAWLTEILETNGLTTLAVLTASDANRGALAKAAEIWYVASLAVGTAQKEDFQAGPVKSQDVKNESRIKLVEKYEARARDCLSKAGLYSEKWTFGHVGGDDYHPDGADNTNVGFREATATRPHDLMGGSGDVS